MEPTVIITCLYCKGDVPVFECNTEAICCMNCNKAFKVDLSKYKKTYTDYDYYGSIGDSNEGYEF